MPSKLIFLLLLLISMDVTEKSESPISELKWLLVSFSAKFFF